MFGHFAARTEHGKFRTRLGGSRISYAFLPAASCSCGQMASLLSRQIRSLLCEQKTLSSFPTATTTTNYNYLWDTDSEGKVTAHRSSLPLTRITFDSLIPDSCSPIPVFLGVQLRPFR